MSHLKTTPCLSCLASLWGHLQNNGVAPEVIYDALERQIKQDEEAFEIIKHELSFEQVVEHQMKIFQIYRFLSLLQSVKAHR